MDSRYNSLKYSDNEKTMAYVKAIIKAVNMTHEVSIESEIKSKKVREAIESKDKKLMWNTLQEYIHNYIDFINQSPQMGVYSVNTEFYNNITVADIEQQLNIMIGIIYDYEAKHCIAKETIKKCLEKLLKMSKKFTKKEIEILLL